MDNLPVNPVNPGTQNQDEAKKINWRQFGKHWIVVFVLAILALGVIWLMLQAGPLIRKWQDWRTARALQKQLEAVYKNDTYGGQTPEETFDLFISALEKGDVQLASKYFVIDKQEEWLKTLQEYQREGLIADFEVELKDTKTKWKKVQGEDPNIIQFDSSTEIEEGTFVTLNNGQKVELPKGVYANATIFVRYLSGVWKIKVL